MKGINSQKEGVLTGRLFIGGRNLHNRSSCHGQDVSREQNLLGFKRDLLSEEAVMP
jgi:hypothetical protein